MRDPANLHEIEVRAKARLESKGLQVEEFDLGHFPENVRGLCVNLGVEGGRTIGEIARNTFEQGVVLRLILVCKNFSDGGDEEKKREESLPILEAIIKILLLQDFNLQIKKLRLRDFRYRTSPEAFEDGFIVWEINFETSLNYEGTDDEEEEAEDLKSIFVDYFLQDTIEEEKDKADASDLIDNLDE